MDGDIHNMYRISSLIFPFGDVVWQKKGSIIYLVTLSITTRSFRLFPLPLLDKLFMGTFPHNFACPPSEKKWSGMHATDRLCGQGSGRYRKLWAFHKNYSIIIFSCPLRPPFNMDFHFHFPSPFSFSSSLWWLSGQFIVRNIRTDYFLTISSFGRDGFICHCEGQKRTLFS